MTKGKIRTIKFTHTKKNFLVHLFYCFFSIYVVFEILVLIKKFIFKFLNIKNER